MTNPAGGWLLDLPLEQRIDKLENDLATVVWLHAELIYALQLAAVNQLAQQLQQTILDQLKQQR